MEGYGTMPGAAMACMTASLLIAFGLPLGLGLFFRRRGGRWRAFLLGAAVFLVFALVLEQRAHHPRRPCGRGHYGRSGTLRTVWGPDGGAV